MRILHSIHSANPKGGGPIEGLKQLAALNTMVGHSVEVVTLDSPDSPWLKDFPIPIHATGPSYLGYGYTPRFVPWLREHHRDYDVVIVNGIWQYASFGTWRALADTSTPYCVFTHGMLDPWFKKQYPLKHLKKWLYWPWGDYRVLRDALAVLFTTEEERRLARRSFWLFRCDEVVISYGIRAPNGDESSQREVFLSAFPHLRGKRLLLFLGRVHEKKGCELLIEAFARLLRANASGAAPLHLVFGGPFEGDYGDSLKAMISRAGIEAHVTWTGMLAGDLKWGAFYSAEAFVLPSHQENFGIAIAEALACGVPVLISNRVNIWREIKLHNAGLVESDDLAGTERLLKTWDALPAETKSRMRLNARSCFMRCFNIDSNATAFIDTLRLLGVPRDR